MGKELRTHGRSGSALRAREKTRSLQLRSAALVAGSGGRLLQL